MAAEPQQPNCQACGTTLVCKDCNDDRPTVDDLYEGWRFRTPFGRWELVTKVERSKSGYGNLLIWTQETGELEPWSMPGYRKVTGHPPEQGWGGTPEIRVIEFGYARDAPIYVVATTDANHAADITGDNGVLAQASYTREEGWTVARRTMRFEDERQAISCSSKAKARTEIKRIARDYAKRMGVQMRVAPPR